MSYASDTSVTDALAILPPSKLNPEFFLYLCKSFDGRLEIMPGMGGGDLNADAGFAFGNDGVREPDDVNAFGEHGIGELRGQGRVADHDRRDRVRAGQDIEPKLRHFSSEKARIVLEFVAQRRRFRKQFEHLE